jgi:alkaline phosphatase D
LETSLLGKAQWEWLKKGLSESTAPFKVLACGLVWNGAVRLLKTDHWMTYEHERDALFSFLGTHRISGVLLVSGDIHRSRAFRYATSGIVGYDLTEIISSPLANTTMAVAKVPSPEVIADGADEHSFLLLTADTTVDPPALTGQCLTATGQELFRIGLDLSQLTPRR